MPMAVGNYGPNKAIAPLRHLIVLSTGTTACEMISYSRWHHPHDISNIVYVGFFLSIDMNICIPFPEPCRLRLVLSRYHCRTMHLQEWLTADRRRRCVFGRAGAWFRHMQSARACTLDRVPEASVVSNWSMRGLGGTEYCLDGMGVEKCVHDCRKILS